MGERKGGLTVLVRVVANVVVEEFNAVEALITLELITTVDAFTGDALGRGRLPGTLVVSLTGIAGAFTVVVAKLGPVVEAVAVALALLDVAPGVNVLWLLLNVPAGEILIALLLAPAPVLLTKALELLELLTV